MERWDWGVPKTKEMESYGDWTESKKQALGITINEMLKDLQHQTIKKLQKEFPKILGNVANYDSNMGSQFLMNSKNSSKIEMQMTRALLVTDSTDSKFPQITDLLCTLTKYNIHL